ncbi:DUF6020 family protein [Bifidobacterium aquikefiricola]|uniref:DUF6020 family protein n=1 Tax=Bifidobacterium aquikefiricola TaxID=3059038 RepID=A0AB39U5Y6_9BIFI
MSNSRHDSKSHPRSILSILRWVCITLVCMWIALCTSVGPIYRANASITSYSWVNALIFIATLAITLGIVIAVMRWACAYQGTVNYSASTAEAQGQTSSHPKLISPLASRLRASLLCRRPTRLALRAVSRGWSKLTPWIMRFTSNRRRLFLVFVIGWLWADVTLLAAYGADIHSQINEFNLWWANLRGVKLPYLQGFTQMDIYPTAHYLWPKNPTYLTDQHNYLLTLFYGAVVAVLRKLSGSDDAGIVALAAMQMLFAAFCCASTANRFFNHGMRTGSTHAASPRFSASAGPRLAIIALFLLTPISVFSTISITKSPAFAYSFVWWIGTLYAFYRATPLRRSLHGSDANAKPANGNISSTATARIPRSLKIELAVSSLLMLSTVKYGVYVVVVQLVLSLLADRRHWKSYVLCMLVPVIAFEALLMSLVSAGAVIQGDPIEAKGIQLQQIARVAQRDPANIPAQARQQLEPILDLDTMALRYNPNDADPVKSSGGTHKLTVYKWRTVTAADMTQFNSAWLAIGMKNPVLYIDAFMAECYGYFDVTDVPYVSMNYYVNNGYVQDSSTWIKNWSHTWRDKVAGFAFVWGRTPVLGWLTNGNFWLVLSLLLICIEFALKRFRALSYQTTLLVLIGVMVFAPANNYDRHILPLVFVFGFLTLAFVKDTQALAARDDAASSDALRTARDGRLSVETTAAALRISHTH